jgi:hypothetical protein
MYLKYYFILKDLNKMQEDYDAKIKELSATLANEQEVRDISNMSD